MLVCGKFQEMSLECQHVQALGLDPTTVSITAPRYTLTVPSTTTVTPSPPPPYVTTMIITIAIIPLNPSQTFHSMYGHENLCLVMGVTQKTWRTWLLAFTPWVSFREEHTQVRQLQGNACQ